MNQEGISDKIKRLNGIIVDCEIPSSKILDLESFHTLPKLQFNGVHFRQEFRFYNSPKMVVEFENCVFDSKVEFFRITWQQGFIFNNVQFKSLVEFRDNVIPEPPESIVGVPFLKCRFNGGLKIVGENPNPAGVIFRNLTVFAECSFSGLCEWRNVTFRWHLYFERCNFASPIELFDVEIKGHIQVTDCKFSNHFKALPTADAFFAKLKLYFDAQGSKAEYYRFFALEERAKNLKFYRVYIANGKNWMRKMFLWLGYPFRWSSLFWLVSNYGQSLWRPLGVFVIATASSVLALWCSSGVFHTEIGKPEPKRVAEFSEYLLTGLKTIIKPLHSLDQIVVIGTGSILIFVLMSVIQLTAIGFFVMALRRRFKT